LLKQYDTDDTRTITQLELTSMLDSLGSTLSTETIDSFYTRWNKNPQTDELTFPETIQCLETEICRPTSERKRLYRSDSDVREHEGTSTPQTPNLHIGTQTPPLYLDTINFSGLSPHITDIAPSVQRLQTKHATESSQGDDAGAAPKHPQAVRQTSMSSSLVSDTETPGSSSGSESKSGDEAFERVINIKNCPLCHRPRLNKRAERDIVTHLAVCASQDWARVDRIMVSNFVTASQAQRKWYTNVLDKLSAGNYKIGAVRVLYWPVILG
jgi:phosphatidylserine decarboxylase